MKKKKKKKQVFIIEKANGRKVEEDEEFLNLLDLLIDIFLDDYFKKNEFDIESNDFKK